jgi:CubicO group peptidase (beta-lactamase class C family)
LHPPDKAIAILGALSKTAEFRLTLKYHNWTYAVAGLIIEQYSGMTIGESMKKHFFDPLDLKRTTFEVPENDNYAACHITLSDGTLFEVPRPLIGSGTLMAGAAGLESCLHDLLSLYCSLL